MNLELTETQMIFRDSLRAFIEEEVPFSRVRDLEKRQNTLQFGWKVVPELQDVTSGIRFIFSAEF